MKLTLAIVALLKIGNGRGGDRIDMLTSNCKLSTEIGIFRAKSLVL